MGRKVKVADRFVQAKHDVHGRRATTPRAFVIHMAEGTNVWRYLAYGNVARGVSVHFTVEIDGEIVQMMGLNRISGSIDPNTIRTSDDSNGHYGASHNKFALGGWWTNPNHAVITVEVAGRAVDGPNDKQVQSLVRLFDYLRGRWPRIIPLGHRDFQAVKPCPGQKMWWKGFKALGGHGKDYDRKKPAQPVEEEEPMLVVGDNITRSSSHYVTLPEGVPVYEQPGDGEPMMKTRNRTRNYDFFGRVKGEKGWWAIEILAPSKYFNDGQRRRVIAYIKQQETYELVERPATPVVPPPVGNDQERIAELESVLESVGVSAQNIGDEADDITMEVEEVLSTERPT